MKTGEEPPPPLEIRPLGSPEEARLCAWMMAGSEPWITLKRGYEESLAAVEDRSTEYLLSKTIGPIREFRRVPRS